MSSRGHIRIFVFATIVWAGFWLLGLPAYYQQYSNKAMIWYDALLLLPIAAVFFLLLRRVRPARRMTIALWYAFYFTVPLFVYDWLFCGVYLGYGLGFLSRYWYLTVYYAIPWVMLPILVLILEKQLTKQPSQMPNPPFQRTRTPPGSGPLNSNRWRGASRRPNGTEVNVCPVSGAAPANRSFKLTYAGYSRRRRAPDSLAP